MALEMKSHCSWQNASFPKFHKENHAPAVGIGVVMPPRVVPHVDHRRTQLEAGERSIGEARHAFPKTDSPFLQGEWPVQHRHPPTFRPKVLKVELGGAEHRTGVLGTAVKSTLQVDAQELSREGTEGGGNRARGAMGSAIAPLAHHAIATSHSGIHRGAGTYNGGDDCLHWSHVVLRIKARRLESRGLVMHACRKEDAQVFMSLRLVAAIGACGYYPDGSALAKMCANSLGWRR